LSDEEIETMLHASIEHAHEDLSVRALREQQVEADRVLEALDAALAKDGDQLLSAEEKTLILSARTKLVEQRNNAADTAQIKQAIKVLEKVSEEYVARRMNNSVSSLMRGRKLEEFNAAD